VPIDDVAGYGRAIIHLHQQREELAAKSIAARARVEQEFSVAAMTDRWLAAFPSEKPVIEPWPNRWRTQGVLTAGNQLRFSLPMRILRRVAMRMRS
jgi:hypothetical protein